MGGGLCEGIGCAGGPALRSPISPSPTWTATPPPVTAARRRLPPPRRQPPSSRWSQLLALGRPRPPSGAAPPLRCALQPPPEIWGSTWGEVLGSRRGQELRLQRGEKPQTDPRGWLTRVNGVRVLELGGLGSFKGELGEGFPCLLRSW